jgi:hypothetical protein
MNDVEHDQLAIQFANFLRKIPHRTNCARTKGTDTRCNCDIGSPSLKVFNSFVELLSLAKAEQP